MTDLVGQAIVPGSIIAYAIRSGDSGKLQIGKVIKAAMKKRYEWSKDDDPKVFRITVQAVERDWIQ